jgi:serine/threonine protein kinase
VITAKPRRALDRTLPALSQSEPLPFFPGQRIADKYQITRLLGTGGIGFVVAATHTELGEQVAIKFLRRQMLKSADVVGRFAQEARATARLKSRDLFTVLEDEGPQPSERAVDFVLQACEALADAHTCGIIHRDIKPDNLFLARRSRGVELVKVLDFGISRVALTGSAIDSRFSPVKTVLPVGTPMYMSPEQIRAAQDIDHRTDIWSLGCVLYELLSGHPVFNASAITQVSARILEQDPEPLRAAVQIPPGLEACITRCLQKDPQQRFQNVAELAVALCPFGSRWARVSAERCCLLLSAKGPPTLDLESTLPESGIRLHAKPTSACIASGRKAGVLPPLTGNLHQLPIGSGPPPGAHLRPWVALVLVAVALFAAGLGWRFRPTAQRSEPRPESPPTRAIEQASPAQFGDGEGRIARALGQGITSPQRPVPAVPPAVAERGLDEKARAPTAFPNVPRGRHFPYRWKTSPPTSSDPDPGF